LEVKRGSPARRLGFRRGDLIHAINGTEFETSEELAGVLQQSQETRRWKITYRRDDKVRNVVFQ
jgi:S1-C subfamily serine protease